MDSVKYIELKKQRVPLTERIIRFSIDFLKAFKANAGNPIVMKHYGPGVLGLVRCARNASSFNLRAAIVYRFDETLELRNETVLFESPAVKLTEGLDDVDKVAVVDNNSKPKSFLLDAEYLRGLAGMFDDSFRHDGMYQPDPNKYVHMPDWLAKGISRRLRTIADGLASEEKGDG